jgi:hypothetical protein
VSDSSHEGSEKMSKYLAEKASEGMLHLTGCEKMWLSKRSSDNHIIPSTVLHSDSVTGNCVIVVGANANTCLDALA